MARELRRLLIEPCRLSAAGPAGGRLALRAEEEHYLARVLRLRPGDPVALIDGRGGLWQATRGEASLLENLRRCGEPEAAPAPALSLVLALPRQEVELVWRMACELGIDRLQPLRSERSPLAERRPQEQRWQAVLREATEQCERLWLPVLEPVREADDWFAQPVGAGVFLLATTRRHGLPALESLLASHGREATASGGISLAIGPEGGWSPAEERRAEAAGWLPVSLGSTILRCSTAAVAASSRLVAWRLSCAPCREPSP